MIAYAHAVLRFWWVLALGALVAVLAMVAVSKSGAQTYTSVSEVLVTSPQAPYVRISVTDAQGTATTPTPRGTRTPTTPLATTSAPDVNTLVRAANLYPFFIESDLVTRQRDQMFGPLEGAVSARAIFAVANALRFDPSEIPIIQIAGAGSSPGQSVKIAQATTDAFVAWIRVSQDDAGLRPRERIVIQQIKRPTEIFVTGGTSTSLVLLVGMAMLFGFAALAVLLDRTLGGDAAGLPLFSRSDPQDERSKTVELPAAVASEAAAASPPEDAKADSDATQLREGRRWA